MILYCVICLGNRPKVVKYQVLYLIFTPGHVKNLPIQVLKIDRSFVRDLPDDNDDVEIVRAIIALAHNLRLKVVAEGIENQLQLEFLVDKFLNKLKTH